MNRGEPKRSHRQIAIVAASWWGKQLQRTDLERFWNGKQTLEDSASTMFLYIVADRISNQNLLTFQKELEECIFQLIQEQEELLLYVKQWPCAILEHCSNIADIGGNSFPWNTSMHITKEGEILVKAGKDDHEFPI